MSEGYVADYASAVMPVFAWVTSNDWLETYNSHFDEFYSQLGETIDAPIEAILGELPTPFFARAARSVFDDFLTTEFEPGPVNALDQYLNEFGGDLEEADVDFLKAFRRSFVRVYHVSDRTPDESVVLREMSGGDEPIQIDDEMLTAGLSPGDKIATRIVTVSGKPYLAGSILVLDLETLSAFEQVFESAVKEAMREAQKHLRRNPHHKIALRQHLLREAGPILAGMWVASVLGAFQEFSIANEDDPDTLFQGTIPFDSELDTILDCLDAHPDLERPIQQEFVWVWPGARANPEASLKALLWISGSDIVLESCESRRLEEVAESLVGLLGDSVGELTIEQIGRDDAEFDESDENEAESVSGPLGA